MAIDLDGKILSEAILTERWSALARTALDPASIAAWSPRLVRMPRLLVPVDLQALYVPEAGLEEKFVRIPLKLTAPGNAPAEPSPEPFAAGIRRPAGVHLHWAVPDALMSGRMSNKADTVTDLAPLANRWVVLRIVVPDGADKTAVRGWVIESDTSRVFDLNEWKEGITGGEPLGHALEPEELTATAGGALNWTAAYDACINRFALHDPLDDLAETAPGGVLNDLGTYVVAGWWSAQTNDPLDPARSAESLNSRLDMLGWSAPPYTPEENRNFMQMEQLAQTRIDLGLAQSDRIEITRVADQGAALVSKRMAKVGTAEIFMPDGTHFTAVEPKQVYATLLHGQIHGVPVAGRVMADRRPDGKDADLVVGAQIEDVIAGFATKAMGADELDERRQNERLLTAIASDSMSRIAEPNGVIDVEEREHRAGFVSTPGDGRLEEIILDGGGPQNMIAGRHARNRGKTRDTNLAVEQLALEMIWTGQTRGLLKEIDGSERLIERAWETRRRPQPPSKPSARTVRRPGPRYFQPIEPVMGLRNFGRAMRQRVARGSPDGTLRCRWPSQVATSSGNAVDGRVLLGSFPSGAIPEEIRKLAQNAIAFDPYLISWVAERSAKISDIDAEVLRNRLTGEIALRFSPEGIYTGGVPALFAQDGIRTGPLEARISDQLHRFSLADGADPSPVAVTTWAQPWLPTWLEWEIELDLTDRLGEWRLGAVDLEGAPPPGATQKRILSGRSQINTGATKALINAISGWIELEEVRDVAGPGEADEDTEELLEGIVRHLDGVDIASATLGGILDTLLGLPHSPDGLLRERVGDEIRDIRPVDAPMLLFSGRLRLVRARLIDAFGRVLDLDAKKAVYPAREAPPDGQEGMLLRPRLSRPSRWFFRFADPGDPAAIPRPATLDQAHPELMINPVSGYLLPDLIDEALEFFDTSGNPLGQLMQDPISGGVAWEIAPGREGAVDAGPLFGLAPQQLPVGRLAAAMVEVDAKVREGKPIELDEENLLAAFLRAIDTTLWSVDAFAMLGTPYIAGLVGRPMAVVRATLQLQVDDDLDSLDLSDEEMRAARERKYRELKDRGFSIRLGELTRDDDGLYGFFVNDDYTRFHLVDKLVQDQAFLSGRFKGHFGQLGKTPKVPGKKPISHPYIVAEDELVLYPDQVVRLTMLMHPAGKVHLTSGLMPRKSLQLLRDWIEPGLARIAPSARIGPVLIDADKVRLPKVAAFGKDQTWTRRDTPITWRDDPILAATQTALLPDPPAKVEEGYIRITPTEPPKGESG